MIRDNIPPMKHAELFWVEQYKRFLNFALFFLNKIFFAKVKTENVKNILIYKIGNIGDITCAIPSFIAIRKFYPTARITLLTSPGGRGAPGAYDLLHSAWFFDEIKTYYDEDIHSYAKKSALLKDLRKYNLDLFIQIPTSNFPSFRVLARNLVFAKLIGAKSAYGFEMRGLITLFFRKAQIDYIHGEKESEALLNLLRRNGVVVEKPEFDFAVPKEAEEKISRMLVEKWPAIKFSPVAICPGGKHPSKKWPPERFGEALRYLQNTYGAKIVVLGGKDDLGASEIIVRYLNPGDTLVLTAQLTLKESVATLARCSFLLTNDSGLMHIAAGLGKPTVALFSILGILGEWFPYGDNHEIIFHRFLNCNYHNLACIKRSMELISVEEVCRACDRIIKTLNPKP